eukprot:gb/GEZN01002567.1/.p1 GENE.gb/GEZN01002567.1/~~gb/GEZN01002567.1/.p1  ORF type:complete len:712 (-),score=129.36 gb/GEZN01002567.1/:255-2390(-)
MVDSLPSPSETEEGNEQMSPSFSLLDRATSHRSSSVSSTAAAPRSSVSVNTTAEARNSATAIGLPTASQRRSSAQFYTAGTPLAATQEAQSVSLALSAARLQELREAEHQLQVALKDHLEKGRERQHQGAKLYDRLQTLEREKAEEEQLLVDATLERDEDALGHSQADANLSPTRNEEKTKSFETSKQKDIRNKIYALTHSAETVQNKIQAHKLEDEKWEAAKKKLYDEIAAIKKEMEEFGELQDEEDEDETVGTSKQPGSVKSLTPDNGEAALKKALQERKRHAKIEKRKQKESVKILRVRKALRAIRLRDLDTLLRFKPVGINYILNILVMFGCVILNGLTFAYTLNTFEGQQDIVAESLAHMQDWKNITLTTLALPIVLIETGLAVFIFFLVFFVVPSYWVCKRFGRKLQKNATHFFQAGAVLVAWADLIRFLQSFSILRTLALLKLGNLLIYKNFMDVLTIRGQHLVAKHFTIFPRSVNVYFWTPLVRLIVYFFAFILAAVGVWIAIVAIAVKIGIVASKVPFIKDAGKSTVVEWQWPELVVFFGFINQLLGITVPEDSERWALTRLVFGGPRGHLTRLDNENADYFNRLISSAMFIRYGGWLGALIFATIEAKDMQAVLCDDNVPDGDLHDKFDVQNALKMFQLDKHKLFEGNARNVFQLLATAGNIDEGAIGFESSESRLATTTMWNMEDTDLAVQEVAVQDGPR